MRKMTLAILALCLGSTSALAERPGVGVGVTVGTLGAGITGTLELTPVLNARAWVSGFSVDLDADTDDLEYEGEVDVFNVGALLDYHPWRNGLRASIGVFYTGNNFDGTATCSPSNGVNCDVGNDTDVVLNGDQLSGEVDYSGAAPYLGIGWGNAVDKAGRWSFSFDLGAMFTGSPDVTVRCERAIDLNLCNQAISAEEDDLEDDVGDFDVYPVLSFGAAYRF